MRIYIASFNDGKYKCWDMILKANNYKEAMKEARKMQKENGKLWRVKQMNENELPF